jgi:hypothetical protein
MNRRELFQKALGVGAAVAAASILRGQSGSFTGPAGGSRGSQLITIVTGPFDTSSYPNGVRPVTDTPQFATYVRIQAHPGQDGTVDNGRSDTWIMSDPRWLNSINLADLYVWPEIAGETPVVTAFQLL